MAVCFSPDGQSLAYSDINDHNKVFLGAPDGSDVLLSMEGSQSPVGNLFFSPDSRLLVSSDPAETRIWDTGDSSLRYVGKDACQR